MITFCAVDRDRSTGLALGIPREAKVVAYHGRIQIWSKRARCASRGLASNLLAKDLESRFTAATGRVQVAMRRNYISALLLWNLQGVVWIDEYIRDRTKNSTIPLGG